jgi:hypothetical protein
MHCSRADSGPAPSGDSDFDSVVIQCADSARLLWNAFKIANNETTIDGPALEVTG